MGPFMVQNQRFALVDQMTSGLIDGDLAGIMGLAFQSIASTQAVPFWQALVNNNEWSQPIMSFQIARFVDDPQATEDEPGGVLTFGGTNSSLFTGNIDFQNFPSGTQASFWLQTVTSVSVGGKSVSIPSGNGALAAIDTGTTLIGGPTDAVNNIWGAVSGASPMTGQDQGFWAFPCNTKVNVTFSFGGNSWPISPSDMNLGSVGGGMCRGAIFDVSQGSNIPANGGTPSWIVGGTFLKNVYTVFRASPPSVGFAQLSNAAGGSPGSPGSPTGSSRVTQTGNPLPSVSGSGAFSVHYGSGSVATAVVLSVLVSLLSSTLIFSHA
ncbi:hypothetical protein EWM64_g1613 [Hericium alpestre]|uniref:Peptidase A1 domain-containing protein n=1 Tax=Hericium alpestre TaxID=135208 RepID=A0A4Z0A803_9AGAM|nr:hypothetical protein EWM64_g1613 [Hericium alpestre]